MGAADPKSVKEMLVYPLDAPTTMEDFVNPNGVVPSWQSRPTDYNLEEDLLHDVLVEHSKILQILSYIINPQRNYNGYYILATLAVIVFQEYR